MINLGTENPTIPRCLGLGAFATGWWIMIVYLDKIDRVWHELSSLQEILMGLAVLEQAFKDHYFANIHADEACVEKAWLGSNNGLGDLNMHRSVKKASMVLRNANLPTSAMEIKNPLCFCHSVLSCGGLLRRDETRLEISFLSTVNVKGFALHLGMISGTLQLEYPP